MIILSHRGYWKSEEERNQEVAFHRSFDLGYGTETDIRDIQGKLVISHDMPQGYNLQPSLPLSFSVVVPYSLSQGYN